MATEAKGSQSAAPPEKVKPTSTELVVFGKHDIADLPAPVRALMQKFKTREIPGVAPTWKPEKPSDTIAGICVRYREGVGQFKSSLIVLEGEYGFRSVWLGADLKQKITAESIGRPMVIVYEGMMQIGTRPQPMRTYRVIEVLEPEEAPKG